MQTTQFFAILAMDVEHIDMHTPGTVVNFKCSMGESNAVQLTGSPSSPL